MDLPPALLQFIASFGAILVLAAVARMLKLGPKPRLSSEEDARLAADEAVDGFAAVEIGLDQDGAGAILRDAAGRVLLLRAHGVHFAGRLLTPAAEARIEAGMLVIDTAEPRYGSVRLALENPQAWVQQIEAIE